MNAKISRRVVCSAAALLFLLTLTSCAVNKQDAVAVAYIAPASINLRRDLRDKPTPAVQLNHGDRVQVLELRRRFVKIRSEKGVEGWVDGTQLLNAQQMETIRADQERALALPAEGTATVYEALNIHIDPSRQSPAFARITEGMPVEVLAHRLSPKVTGPPKMPVFDLKPAVTAPTHGRKARKQRNDTLQLPKPAVPQLPDNWQELSQARVEPPKPQPQPEQPEEKKPVILEDWTLVRTKQKQCGWVLSRNLVMSIPDEVAQYAEGKRITSFFALAAVNDDEKGTKHDWLWTTASEQESYDFDGWRVFLWNRRRHRYETSYRERDVEGYFPVRLGPAEANSPTRTFELILKGEDGKLWRSNYSFDGVRVHLTGREPYTPQSAGPAKQESPRTKPSHLSFWQKLRR